ncbi:hypothetical protein MPTA5024_07580 [Microbispora sp. ATCC PTA-5024]|nr:hypothetical protein MPTA5024_07580 [Microbispora sp. ATCC PTA-5024]
MTVIGSRRLNRSKSRVMTSRIWTRPSSSAASMRSMRVPESATSVHCPQGVKVTVPLISDHSAATRTSLRAIGPCRCIREV